MKGIDRETEREAKIAVEDAIAALALVPKNYGGHRSGEGTSMVENVALFGDGWPEEFRALAKLAVAQRWKDA